MIPTDRKYTKSHEWTLTDGDTATIGLTAYAQDQLGDIVFVELPEIGDVIAAGERLAVIESVKAASDVFAPVGGEVIDINEALSDEPEKINEAPWDAWIAKIKVTDAADALLDAAAYEAVVKAEEAQA